MCTVTYLPAPRGFILTHNRDEAPSRVAPGLMVEEDGERRLFYPRDAGAGGSWLIASNTGFAVCVLNGAFVKHERTPPYRRSRGWVLLDFARAARPEVFFQDYDLSGIEPFTLLYATRGQLVEFRWDGQHRHFAHKPANQPHFWSSVTLYDPPIQVAREAVFFRWLQQHPRPTPAALRQLHLTGSIGDPENDFCMNRQNRVRTVGLTQVVFTLPAQWLRYRDLLHNEEAVRRIF